MTRLTNFLAWNCRILLVVEVCAGTARAYKDHPGTWNHGGLQSTRVMTEAVARKS